MRSKYVVLSIVVVLILCVGVSYSYFIGENKGNKKNLKITSKDISIVLTDNMEISEEEIILGWRTSKSFSVKNNSNEVFNYNITIKDLINTFVTEGFLQYKITSTNGYNMSEYKDIPKSNEPKDIVLAYDIDIKEGELQEYTIEIIYKNSETVDQSEDMGKILSGTLAIIEGSVDPNILYNVTLNMSNANITSENPISSLKNGRVIFNYTLNEGYTLEGKRVECDNGAEGEIEENKITISKITKDNVCTVSPEKLKYTLTMVVKNGSTSPSNVVIEYGGSKEFTIVPSTNYTTTGMSVECNGSATKSINGSKVTIGNIKENQTCTVTTKILPKVTLTVTNGTGGGTKYVSTSGGNVTFTISPNSGYGLFGDIEGDCTLSGNTVTASNVTSDRTCKITLKNNTLYNKILADHKEVKTRSSFDSILGDANATTGVIYKTSGEGQTEDGSIVYYFAGNVSDNWVKFAGFYWRIIRTNEDGSVRLLYAGTSPNTTQGYIGGKTYPYNGTYNDTMYVGYMYGSTGSLSNNRSNTTSSPIKTTIDNWYRDNINSSYNGYVSQTAIYCNDRSGDGYQTTGSVYYASYNRLQHNNTTGRKPTYKCGYNAGGGYTNTKDTWVTKAEGMYSDASNADKFSKNTSKGGNGKLTYPVGLMTADEVAYAGGRWGTNSPYAYYYLNSTGGSVTGDKYWWTMSPYYFSGGTSRMFGVGGSTYPGRLHDGHVGSSGAVRPVVSLKSCVLVSGGKGTSDSPYEVSVNGTCSASVN